MPKSHSPYPPELRRRLVELVRAGEPGGFARGSQRRKQERKKKNQRESAQLSTGTGQLHLEVFEAEDEAAAQRVA